MTPPFADGPIRPFAADGPIRPFAAALAAALALLACEAPEPESGRELGVDTGAEIGPEPGVAAESAGSPAPDTTVVVTLGTGTPYPDPSRAGPATAVRVGDRFFLFDAGAGVMRQVNAAGLQAMTDHLMAAWEEDIRIRIEGLERELPDVYVPRVMEIALEGEPRVVYDSGGVTITAFPVTHGSWEHAFGFRVDAPDRSIVIAGDARPSDWVAEMARGADVLVHEVYPTDRVEPEDRPGGEYWPEYMRAFHTSGRELGALAAEARPERLLLTHVIWSGGTEEEILAGIRAGGYEGEVVVAEDLGRY